ncbi:hypothetical protein [Salinisphaera sp. T31B1]|uniref:hypothetical protein n=1 Tax=Salinisphaera sp. T31B1 TaxID=727963 RepID=UPI00334049A2
MSELDQIEFAEREGDASMRERIDNASMLQRQATTAITLVLAGAGAALLFAARGAGSFGGVEAGSISIALWLFAIAALLVRKCLAADEYPAAYNLPLDLIHDEHSLVDIRRARLEKLDERIREAILKNDDRARWLNRCYYASAATPLIGLCAMAAWVGFSAAAAVCSAA